MPVLDLADVKRHLNMSASSTTQDDELLDTMEAAEGVVEGIIGPLVARSVTESHYAPGSVILLRHLPVAEVSVVTVDGATVSEPRVDVEAGLLYLPWFARLVTVTYSTGFLTLPAEVKRAILEITAGLWRSQRGASPLPLQGGGGQVTEGATLQFASLISPTARELLAPYRRAASGIA